MLNASTVGLARTKCKIFEKIQKRDSKEKITEFIIQNGKVFKDIAVVENNTEEEAEVEEVAVADDDAVAK